MSTQASISKQHRDWQGFTYIEMMLSVAIMGVVMLALMGVVNTAAETGGSVRGSNDLTRQARFAMQRMVHYAGHSRRLLVPLVDKPLTNWPENIREQTIPPSPPVGDQVFASAVLAVTLPAFVDLDQDDFPDADDDEDGLIDEDLPNDNQHDFQPGIGGIDDDGDGYVDENPSDWWDDDETNGVSNEDPLNGVDDDDDANIDEDTASDMNGDGCPGSCGVDDDGDGAIDEGSADDDDEDGNTFEDPYDPVVYYLSGQSLIERMPVPWNADGISTPDGPVDGRDFEESVIAENVTRLRFERLDDGTELDLVDIVLELTDPNTGENVSLQTRVRIGGAL
jgi:prepilin-type N-terminal cleavage/methylation domain-containing protein